MSTQSFVLVGAVTESYTEEELATLELEVTPEIENILISMLYAKCFTEVTEYYMSDTHMRLLEEDFEAQLNVLVELQERMAKGMKLITECNKTINAAKTGKRLPYGAYIAWVERRKALWNHWFTLKGECDVVATPFMWVKFFDLAAEDDNMYFCSGETEDVDNYNMLLTTPNDRMNDIRDNYLLEVAEFTEAEASGKGFWDNKERNSPVFDVTKHVLRMSRAA